MEAARKRGRAEEGETQYEIQDRDMERAMRIKKAGSPMKRQCLGVRRTLENIENMQNISKVHLNLTTV